MSLKEEIREHFFHGQEVYLRHISIDCVIFGFYNNELKVLLLKAGYANKWALPGGFVLKEEHMDQSAERILKMRTGLDKIYMHQFYVFSDPGRSTKKINQQFLKNVGINAEKSWMFERFITVGYTALVDFTKVIPVPDNISDACEWFSISETILNRKLDRRNFQRKIEATGILKRLNETKKGVAHKAPFYYKFELPKYEKALKAGLGFDL